MIEKYYKLLNKEMLFMKVIPQDKDMIVDFTCGIWRLCDNNIIMESLDGSYIW